jgi:hypothetical protein
MNTCSNPHKHVFGQHVDLRDQSNSWSAKHAKDQLKLFSPQHLSLAGVGGILANYAEGSYNSLLIIQL